MVKKLVMGTMISGVVAFVIGAAWWMVLPWQGRTLKAVADEDAVVSMVRAQMPNSGIYVVPNSGRKQGPLIFAAVKQEGADPANPVLYLKALAANLCAAFLLSTLLLTVSGLSYWGRVKTVSLIALVVCILGHVPNWLWWGFSTEYILAACTGLFVTWFAAGLVLAKMVVHPEDEHTLG